MAGTTSSGAHVLTPRGNPPVARRQAAASWRRRAGWRALLSALALPLFGVAAHTTAETNPARSFLAAVLKVPPEALGRIDAGRVLSRTLDGSSPREVATVGAVRIRVTPEFYVQRLSDIATFKRDERILQIGT